MSKSDYLFHQNQALLVIILILFVFASIGGILLGTVFFD